MAHYAFLNTNNIVTEIIVGKDEGEDSGLVAVEIHGDDEVIRAPSAVSVAEPGSAALVGGSK